MPYVPNICLRHIILATDNTTCLILESPIASKGCLIRQLSGETKSFSTELRLIPFKWLQDFDRKQDFTLQMIQNMSNFLNCIF